jgi:ABC-type multidrug transport system ATPase subunit
MISHNHHLYEELSAEENLLFAATMHGIRADRGRIRKALAEVGLEAHADKKVRTYSTGMKRRLVIGKMLLFDPDLLFLDEPHNTLDQAAIALLNGYVASVKARGGSAIVATHNLSRAYDMADRFVLMREGAVAHRVEKRDLSMEQLRALYTRYAENGEEEPRVENRAPSA